MQRHINTVVSACFYHLRHLRHVQNCVSQDVMGQLVVSLIISRLDSTTVIPCSPAYLHPRWRLYNVYRTLLLD